MLHYHDDERNIRNELQDEDPMTEQNEDSENLSVWWRYAVVIVVIVGFSILGFVTAKAYENAPPIPETVVDAVGAPVFTKQNIQAGQSLFFKYNLMEHGTLWGHGAYLGLDYTAEYLHREALSIRDYLASQQYGKTFSTLSPREQRTIEEQIAPLLKDNRFDNTKDTLLYTPGEVAAYKDALSYWEDYFSRGLAPGLPKEYIKSPEDLSNLVAFFSWASWAAVTNRPGDDCSYTNNFPYDPLLGNTPCAATYLWSALSLITLLGAIGLMLFLFGKFDFLGWDPHRTPRHVHETHVTTPSLTPGQLATLPFFLVVGTLFLCQVLLGGLLAHYRVEATFYGFPITDWMPYNLSRTWHLQAAIFWIATAWIAGGLFIAPLLSGQEPPGQKLGIRLLFAAVVVVIIGSMAGEFVSALRAWPGNTWFWFGNQGSEYLDLGRFWQYLLIVGFLFWLWLLFRAIRPTFSNPKYKELGVLFFLSAAAIPLFYTPALFYHHHTHFTIIDNWRFWIIHLWVEGFFEVFATVLTASMFVKMGVTKLITAKRVIYLDIILYLGSGVVGTGHHWYFSGQATINMALSACFSAMEVVPLTLLTLDAWDFISVSQARCEDCGRFLAARQKWTIYFLIAVGIWNFIGAGVFGFLINLPIVSYFEIGTNLTPNHGHAALFGVFGMLALAVTLFCLRSVQTEDIWNKTKNLIKVGFWGLNIGMGLMVFTGFFPTGVLQLWDAIQNGYWHARQLQFLMSGLFHALEWGRLASDTLFIIFGVIPIVTAIFITVWRRSSKDPLQNALSEEHHPT